MCKDEGSEATSVPAPLFEKKIEGSEPVGKTLEEKLKIADQSNFLQKPVSKMTKKEQLMTKKKPNFLMDEHRMDKNKRLPSDPLYDPSSIYIPSDDFKKLTDGMKRYWEIKQSNMDKVLLYRYGDWYVTYYDDTSICAKIMELTVTPHPG